MREQQWQRQPQKRTFSPRFLLVMLILIASLAAIYFYVIPFLASIGEGRQEVLFQAAGLLPNKDKLHLPLLKGSRVIARVFTSKGVSTMVMHI